MSEEQLQAFLEKVKGDASLQEKLKAASSPDDVAAVAKEAGFDISLDEISNAQSAELSEQELEGVSGAGGINTFDFACQVSTVAVTCMPPRK